jgi:hypothetical protein
MLYLHCNSCRITIGTSHLSGKAACPRCGGLLSRRPKRLFSSLDGRAKAQPPRFQRGSLRAPARRPTQPDGAG